MSVKKAALPLAALLLSAVAGGAFGASVPDAAARGDTEVVRQLVREGADVNETLGDGRTALHLAAETGDLPLVELLLYAGANPDAGTRIGDYTPLHTASRHGRAEIVKALLAAGADVDSASSNSGVLPLHLAAASGSVAAVEALLAAGADPDAPEGAWGQTPLVFAAAANRVPAIKVLLAAGADPSISSRAVDVIEREAADEAAQERFEEVLAEFKRKEAGGPEWSPAPTQLQAAIQTARRIQRGWPLPDDGCDDAEVDECGTDDKDRAPKRMSYGQLVGGWGGLTPLLHAVRQGHAEAVVALLEGGAEIDQTSAGDNTSPLLMAAVNGQFDIALLLLERGADPNIVSDAGAGPLFAVLERRWAPWANYSHPVEFQRQEATYLDVLQALLEAGADPDLRLAKHLWYSEYLIQVLVQAGLHYDGATPFWRAAHALDVEAMRLLVAHGAETDVPTRKIPERRRRGEQANATEEADPSGVPPVAIGGPHVYPIHAAAGAGYGQSYAANAHRHAPDSWLPAVRFLVEECGADVNVRDANGYTPLHHAASRGDNELIRYLVEKGADVTVVSRKGQTTADMANGPIQRVPPFPETIALLVGLGAVNNDNCVSC